MEISGSVKFGEAFVLGDAATSILRYRSTGTTASFTVPDDMAAQAATNIFGAKFTVVAKAASSDTSTGKSAMAMAEFLYTRLEDARWLTNYQEVERGILLKVAVVDGGLLVTSSEAADISALAILMY
jgi:hypothetical protein